ncbi:nucleoside kinase [Anaerophaga thermohalophila]|uniref:nucleoside kinase n=1 Tax=Anaerophaga thermohalophila TaxID=177400 RepID=UPI000237D596|nr:nucleoside kinase [Anaerophaga thermohalophila]
MKKTIRIKCLNNNKTFFVERGTTLKEIADSQNIKLDHPILGAMVNNQIRELAFEIYNPKTIEFIDITHKDGMRMYIRGLSFLLYAATRELFPEARLRIDHSVSKGFYCELRDIDYQPTIDDVFELGQRMKQLVEQDIPIVQHKEETEDVIEFFKQHGLHDKVDLLRHRGQYYSTYYTLKDHIGKFYGFMVPSTGYLKVFDLNKYFNGMLLQVPSQENPDEVQELVEQNKMFEIFREFSHWNQVLNVTNISDLNNAATNGKAERLIKVSEALHEKKIAQIADAISERRKDVRIVLISGPSSSGKTTFGKRLAIQLLVNGICPLNLSLDNYFVDRERTPRDENGQYDFEALEALDIKLFNQHLRQLLAGEEINLPKFNFETGKRMFNGDSLKMRKDNILIIEGIHGLNPKLTHSIENKTKFKIYVSALTNINIDDQTRIPTTDNRLVRRIIRDYRYRNYSALETISRWDSVRRGEDKHIFPYQEEADIMFNSALLYELAVLKPYAEPILLEVQPNQPEYSEAIRLLKFFSYFKPIQQREIPPTSILREFLGGSSFTY